MSVLLSDSLGLDEKSKFKGSVYTVDLSVYTNCITVSDNVIDINNRLLKLYSVGISY